MKYKENKTMEMLGKQYILTMYEREEIRKQYQETFEANMKDNPILNMSGCFDFFMLGYIWGKRDERSKRKKE